MKFILSALAAFFLFVVPAKAECDTPLTKLVEIVQAIPDSSVKPITDAERAQLYAKKGPPPVEGTFEIDIARTPVNSLIAIVQDGCVIGQIGPLPTQLIENVLGNSGA